MKSVLLGLFSALTLLGSLGLADEAEVSYQLIEREGSDKLKAVRDGYGAIKGLDQLFANKIHANGLPYHICIPPALEAGKAYPLVMFLHGHTDLSIGTHKGFPKGIWTLPEVQKKQPHVVFVPRHQEKDQQWDEPAYHKLTMDALKAIIEKQNADPKTPNIDTKRLYITGFSKGGAGTWYFIRQQPNFFAAAAPLAGARRGAQTLDEALPLKDLPIWFFNGDPEERAAMSRKSFSLLKEAGAGKIRFHEYAHRGHVIDDFAYFTPGFFEWLFSQKR